MQALRMRALLSVAIVVGLFGAFGVASASVAAPPGGAVASASAATASTAAPSSSPVSAATVTVPSTGNAASTLAAHALAETASLGISSRDISVPRPSATSAELAAAKAVGHVTPLYSAAPAPSGLGYFGLSSGPGSSVIPTVLNTTSLEGTVDASSAGIFASDLVSTSPDAFGIQLNAVSANITLLGTPGYSFWTQNVVLFYPASGFMILITNVWNFSSPTATMTPNVFYAHGPYGTDYYAELGYYYSELVIPFPVVYPFDLTFLMNSSIVDGRNAVNFTVGLSSSADPSEDFVAPYDYVIFNSLAASTPALTHPSDYTANGFNYNPLGLTDDFELILGGPNGGSNADLSSADATLGLAYLNSATGAYDSVPSAFNYGGETGETVVGANIGWASGHGGPAGLPEWGTASTGPSVMQGLWNAGAPEGTVPVTLDVSPANAFAVFTKLNNSPSLENTLYSQPYAESVLYGPTFYLTPGRYTVSIELSDYTPVTFSLTVSSAERLSVDLRSNYREGIYTPLWAFSNSELRGISYGGTGSTFNPYEIVNNQYAPLASVFGLYNDYSFPVYPGVYLQGTTATTYLDSAAPFTTATSDFQYPGVYLPQTNDLQFWFWGVSHVALVGAQNISGWFGAYVYYPLGWDTFNVIFYGSEDNLIAANHFTTESQALLSFAEGSIFGPANGPGGNNTIWGNTFTQISPPNALYPLMSYALGIGIELAESNDLVYNNYVATPTTAFMAPLNLYSDDPFLYTETWNIPVQSALIVHFAPGFPLVPLWGSIVGGSVQGGNFWWDYGTTAADPNPYNGAVNPIGVLPYDENAPTLTVDYFGPSYYYATYIYNGGDYAPLVAPAHHHG